MRQKHPRHYQYCDLKQDWQILIIIFGANIFDTYLASNDRSSSFHFTKCLLLH